MKKIITVALLFSCLIVSAKEDSGIKFEHNLTWTQMKEKAKKENKYIFVDVFTTWCVPCRMMFNNIFPQPKVAAFFNDNFINVSVQIDVTKKDSKETSEWRNDAKLIEKTYKIDSYPTYLFFNPKGELVHKIIGGTTDADEFIIKAKTALNPATQYSLLKQQYEKGKRDDKFLLQLINSAQQLGDYKLLPIVINKYLATQKNLLSEQNLKFIAASTSNSTDPGFNILIKNTKKIDSILGEGKSIKVINTIAFDEIVLPLVRKGGTKIDNGQMIHYIGEINKNVNWTYIKTKLNVQYAELSDEIMMSAKPTYFRWLNDWPRFCESVSLYYSSYPDIFNNDMLNSYAYTVFNFCDDKKCLDNALVWAKNAVSNSVEKNVEYLITYADILYKSGEKEQAVLVVEKALKSSGGTDEYLKSVIYKMKNNEKTWIN